MVPNLKSNTLPVQGTADSQWLELMVPNLKSNTLPVQGTADSQWLELMVRYRFVLFNGRLAQNAPFGLNGCM